MERAELLMAMEAARLLAARGLVHPVGDGVGHEDVIDWVRQFNAERGLAPSLPLRTGDVAALQDHLLVKAACQGWVLQTQRGHPFASERTMAIERAKEVQARAGELPARLNVQLPNPLSDLALVREVQRELASGLARSLDRGVGLERAGVEFHCDSAGFASVRVEGVVIGEVRATEAGMQRRDVQALVHAILGQTMGEGPTDDHGFDGDHEEIMSAAVRDRPSRGDT